MPNQNIGGLPPAELPLLGTDLAVVSRDGVRLDQATLGDVRDFVGGGGGVLANVNTIGAVRKFGHQSAGNTVSVGGAFGVAFQIKMQAAAPFRRMAVAIHNRNNTYDVGPWQAAFAATENPGYSTAAQFSQPIVGGTTYTALATNDATRYGYKIATFDGQQTSRKVIPGTFSPEYRTRLNIAKPSALVYNSFYNIFGTIVSDWVDVGSVPAVGGGLPWALARLQMLDTSTNPYGGRYTETYNVQPNTDVSIARRTQPGFQDFQGVQVNPTSGQNFVTDPSLTFTPPADIQVYAVPNVTFLFDYIAPCRNILAIGDSQTEAYPWLEIAFAQLSTPEQPINFVNCGMAARQTVQFNQALECYIEAGFAPTDVILPVFSVNDFAPSSSLTDFEAQGVIFRVLERLKKIREIGAKAWLWTSYNGRTGYGFVGQAAQINTINNFFRSYVEANPDSCGMFDFEANWINGAGPDFYTKDGTHANNNGVLLGQVPVVLENWS
jgi:hypothetical protein